MDNMAATEKDGETGEFVLTRADALRETCYSSFDNDTGEFDATITSLKVRKMANFSIPKNLIAPQDDPNKCCIDSNETFTLSKKEDVITLQEEIILGSTKSSHRLFLIIVSISLLTRIVAALAVITEVLIHVWAHKKNAHNINPNIYYRSPLHIITSQFCNVCRHESSMDRVIKLQDQRNKHWRLSLKNVAKNIY